MAIATDERAGQTVKKPKKRKRKPTQAPRDGKPKLRTAMFLSVEVLDASARRAKRLGLSRARYIEQIVRRDLGLDSVNDPNSVFG